MSEPTDFENTQEQITEMIRKIPPRLVNEHLYLHVHIDRLHYINTNVLPKNITLEFSRFCPKNEMCISQTSWAVMAQQLKTDQDQ
jgi:hypothetical protein